MKLAGILKSALVLIALAVTASAKPKSRVTVSVFYPEVTVAEQKMLGNGRIGLRLIAEGLAWTDLDPHDPGVTLVQVHIQQRFEIIARINIDHTSAGIVGRTEVSLTGTMFPEGWESAPILVKGEISGCTDGSCELSLNAKTGKMQMALKGKIEIDPSGQVDISGLGGVIVLRLGGHDLVE